MDSKKDKELVITNEEVIDRVEKAVENKESLPKVGKISGVLGQEPVDNKKENAQKMIKNAMTDEVSGNLIKFEKEFKDFMLVVPSLSKKQLQRVLIKFMAYPMISDNFNLSIDSEEIRVYNNCIAMHAAKANAMLGTIMNSNKPEKKE